VNSSNRTQQLAIATVALLICVVAYHIWANWGLVTIHANGTPLGKVIASIERQGHAKIETDMKNDTPVIMDVVKVPVADALEHLSAATSSRWRLLYFVAGDKATLQSGETAWFSGQPPANWKMLSFPGGGGGISVTGLVDTDTPVVFDPRQDTYTPHAAAPAPIQTFFLEAAQLTTAGFAFPTDWNPTVNSAPPSGPVQKAIPKLIGSAHGRQDQIFFLSDNNQGPGPAARGPNVDFDPALFAQRVQDEINRLPPEQKTEAQNNFDSELAFRQSLATMTADQRAAAWQQHLQDPNFQQMIQNRMDSREGMMSHDQRNQRFQSYVNNKLSITGKM